MGARVLDAHERTAFLVEVGEFCAREEIGESYVGRCALNDTHFVRRLRGGRNVTRPTAERVRQWMADFKGSDHCRRTPEKSFFARIRMAVELRAGPLDTDCHHWLGAKSKDGYATCYSGNKRVQIHREMARLKGINVPDLSVVDHICNNRLCVNPDHHQVITNRQNVQYGFVRRGHGYMASDDHCIHGHELTPSNLITKGRRRICRTCRDATSARSNTRRKQYKTEWARKKRAARLAS